MIMGIADFLKDRISNAPNWLTEPLLHINCLGPLAFGPSMLRFKKSIPTIDPEKKLVDMANYAITHVPYYRKRYRGLTIKSAHEFEEKIGFIDKDEVNRNSAEFLSDLAPSIPHITRRTSGTSGKPLHIEIPRNRYITEMAFVTRAWEHAGWNYGIRASIRKKILPPGKNYIVNPATREIIFDGYRTDKEYLAMMARVMKRNHVSSIYAYPSTAFQALKLFQKHGIDISFIRHALLTSEGISPLQYHFIENELGIKISSFYGHTEKLIFIEQTDINTHVIEEAYGYTEIIGPDGNPVRPGNEGELVGTTFYNRVMPLLRYRTGDYATLSDRTMPERNYSRRILSSISGRHENNRILRHDGSYTSSTVFEIHDEMALPIDGIQYLQERPGYMDVLVVKGLNFSSTHERKMLDHFAYAMGGEEYVKIRYVNSLIVEPNGKTLTVINRLT